MNLPNKITMCRLVLAVMVLILLMFPYGSVGISVPVYKIGTNVTLSLNYIIGGILFMIASFTDFLDGMIARKNNIVTDFGKVMDAIADKILVNGVLIILAYNGNIPLVIPVVIITRDTIVDSIKMVSGSKGKVVGASIWGKIKTICMMVGLSLVFFSNLPFELFGLDIANFLLVMATVFSVISGVQYYVLNKDLIFEKNENK